MLNKEQISTDNHALNSVRLCYGRGDLLSDHNVGILKYNFCRPGNDSTFSISSSVITTAVIVIGNSLYR